MSVINTLSASAFVSAALLAAACAAPGARAPGQAPSIPSTAGPMNLEVRVTEVIERADLDGLAYAKVFVGGEERGQTNIAPRSQLKRWEGRVDPRNLPLRLELWVLPGTGDWQRLADDAQPRERFVRVEAGARSVVELRRHPSGRYDFEVRRVVQ